MTGDLRITFEHEGRNGEVIVSVKPISTGAEAGFDVLPDLPFGLDAVVGYPSMSATLAYEGQGYRQLMGWIQVVGSVRSWRDGRVVESSDVDLSPAWYDADLPFFAFGYSPSVYDAPARNLNGASRLDWCNETFLTTVPRRTRSEPIRRLASFSWGYSETYASADLPSVRTPREIGLTHGPAD